MLKKERCLRLSRAHDRWSVVEYGDIMVKQNVLKVRMSGWSTRLAIWWLEIAFIIAPLPSPSSATARFIDINSAGGQSSDCNIGRRLRSSWVVTDLTRRPTLERPGRCRQTTPDVRLSGPRSTALRARLGRRNSASHYTVAMWHTDGSRNILTFYITTTYIHGCVLGFCGSFLIQSHVLRPYSE